MHRPTRALVRLHTNLTRRRRPADVGHVTEPGFEVAQSMGIALLGLVIAAAFATALGDVGDEVIDGIRAALGL